MEYILITLGIICMVVGVLGCIVPMLPGPPVAYVGMLCFHFTELYTFSTTTLVTWGVVVVLSLVLDYIIPIIGTKFFGGSKWGSWGCVIGTFVGLVAGPVGVIVGPFVGALIGELMGKKPMDEALKSALGSFIGFLFGTLMKIAICAYFIYVLIVAIW